MSAKKITAIFKHLLPVIFTCCLMCTPKPVLYPQVEEKKSEKFFNFTSEQIAAELSRLQPMLSDSTAKYTDSSGNRLTREDIVADIFELCIHRRNASPDYRLALESARYLFERVQKKKLYYANWGNMIKNHLKLLFIRDSLQEIIASISDKSENQQSQSRKQNAQMQDLKTTIRKQTEVIKKLLQMDMQTNGSQNAPLK